MLEKTCCVDCIGIIVIKPYCYPKLCCVVMIADGGDVGASTLC